MRYKKLFYNLILVVFFALWWLYLNRNYIPELDKVGIQGMISLTSAYSGYNNIMTHASIYIILFLIMLIQWMPQSIIQILVRKRRRDFILSLYKTVFGCSLQYSIMFVGILALFVSVFENKHLIIESGFWYGVLIILLPLVFYYFFVGAVFCFFILLTSSVSKSYFTVIVIMVGLFCLSIFLHIWTPVLTLDIFDLLFYNQLNFGEVVGSVLKMVILIVAVFYISFIMYKDKDVLCEKN